MFKALTDDLMDLMASESGDDATSFAPAVAACCCSSIVCCCCCC